MNPQFKYRLLKKSKLLSSFDNQNKGFTLVEVIVVTIIIGVATALAAPLFQINDPLNDGANQSKRILQQARNRAIATTKAVRIQPDPNQPNQRLIVERADTFGCDFFTQLSAPIPVAGSPRDLPVISSDGFIPGNIIRVGGTNGLEVQGTPGGNAIITLTTDVTTAQPTGTVVTLDNNWGPDGGFSNQDLTLPRRGSQQAEISSNVGDWTVCFNSRGRATLYDGNFNEQPSLVLTVSYNGQSQNLTILRGGAIVE